MAAALFKHSSGQLIAFGANMQTRKASKMVCWNCPTTDSWDSNAQQQPGVLHAGYFMTGDHRPEPLIMQEHKATGDVIAWQPDLCIQMIRTGDSWMFRLLVPEIAKPTNYTRR
jgi:hypothetical protein